MTERSSPNLTSLIGLTSEVAKTVLFSAAIGGGVALLITIIYGFVGLPEGFGLSAALGLVLMSALVSGGFSLGGHYLDEALIRRGIGSPLGRSAILLSLVLLVLLLGASLAAPFVPDILAGLIPFFRWVGIGGFVVAAITLFLDQSIWRLRRRMLQLEVENRYLESLAEKDRELEQSYKHLIVSNERNRLARELHDSVSQGLHGIKFSARTLRKSMKTPTDDMELVLDHIESAVDETLLELKRMIAELKPSTLEEMGLGDSIIELAERFAETFGIEATVDVDPVNDLSPEQELALYRVTQEALTNVQRHSQSRRVRVLLKSTSTKIFLTIADEGHGLASEHRPGHGLNNMRTRLRDHGGELLITSEPGAGTIIQAILHRASLAHHANL